jgi:colanic acid/amylovoran biosynthesis glycosyltransferase
MGQRTVASYCTTFLKPEMWHIYRQVTALRGVRTFVMTKKLEDPARFPFPDVELIPQPRMNLLRHGWLKFVKREPPVVYRGEYEMLASLLDRRGADLMHIYFGHTGVHLLPFIEQWNKPCVVSFHGADVASKPEVGDYERKLRRLFEAVPLILARSQSLADRLMQLGCPPERLRLNRTGVPLGEFPLVQRDPPVKGHWRLLQACRLIPKKGVSTSIRAFAILQREFPNAELFIAGKGPLQPKLEGLAAQLGISEKVHFCGFLTQKELMKLYATSHLFLHPSETELDQNQEGIPNSVLEAMSTGLAVAATRHGGIPEAVQHGRTGLLVKEGDFVSLAESVAAIMRSAQAFREMGWLASESVAVNFEQSEQIRQLESFYDEAIAVTRAEEDVPASAPVPVSASFPERVRVELKS